MYLLIDECCGKALVRVAEDLGHTAQRTRDIAELGQGAADWEIFRFARKAGAILVTANCRDFEALASHEAPHPGMIFVPPILGGELARLFRIAVPIAETIFDGSENQVVEVQESGRIFSFST